METKDKLIWPIEKVYPWAKNPRSIHDADFESLKKKIQKFGQFKPLVVTPEGEILGGNMRYRAYKELGVPEVWVSVVEPKDDNEKLEISLADNESAGFYVPELLKDLVQGTEIDRDLYRISLEEGKSLSDFMHMFNPEDANPTEQEQEESPEVIIEITTKKKVFFAIKKILDEWEQKYGLEYNVS